MISPAMLRFQRTMGAITVFLQNEKAKLDGFTPRTPRQTTIVAALKARIDETMRVHQQSLLMLANELNHFNIEESKGSLHPADVWEGELKKSKANKKK